MTDSALRRDFEARNRDFANWLAECRRLLAQRRPARLDGADDDEGAGVRVPVNRTPRSPQRDVAHAQPPAPHYYLDVVGDCDGKVTIEEPH